ncbi:hypothetical protein ACQP04_02455 [Pseudonocardia halophobica]|uniref:hypothetical protein n=1 Tax=Pseudonocardia halophobica TaxID=29401 RepID=UPI003D8F2DA8
MDTDRQLTVEFTSLLLASVAPDELAVLDESAQEYFADPAAALADGREDVPLGSGLDVAMITPYLMAVASAVLPVLGQFTADLAKDVGKDLVKEPTVTAIRRLFRRSPAEPAAALTPAEMDQVRAVVLRQSVALGLPPTQAELIANATVGALHVR